MNFKKWWLCASIIIGMFAKVSAGSMPPKIFPNDDSVPPIDKMASLIESAAELSINLNNNSFDKNREGSSCTIPRLQWSYLSHRFDTQKIYSCLNLDVYAYSSHYTLNFEDINHSGSCTTLLDIAAKIEPTISLYVIDTATNARATISIAMLASTTKIQEVSFGKHIPVSKCFLKYKLGFYDLKTTHYTTFLNTITPYISDIHSPLHDIIYANYDVRRCHHPISIDNTGLSGNVDILRYFHDSVFYTTAGIKLSDSSMRRSVGSFWKIEIFMPFNSGWINGGISFAFDELPMMRAISSTTFFGSHILKMPKIIEDRIFRLDLSGKLVVLTESHYRIDYSVILEYSITCAREEGVNESKIKYFKLSLGNRIINPSIDHVFTNKIYVVPVSYIELAITPFSYLHEIVLRVDTTLIRHPDLSPELPPSSLSPNNQEPKFHSTITTGSVYTRIQF